MLNEDRSLARMRPNERGIAPWLIVVLIVVVVIIIVAAVTYFVTKPSSTPSSPAPKTCGGGTVNVQAWLRGAATGNNYTVTTTATRRCDLGQPCTCGNIQGSFGTPTTPCDQYDGNAGPVTSTDSVTPTPLVTDFKKSISNLREGVWQISITVSTGLQSVTKTCCVIVQSGQNSSLTFWCQSLGLPGVGGTSTCIDCTESTTPAGPIGLQPGPP